MKRLLPVLAVLALLIVFIPLFLPPVAVKADNQVLSFYTYPVTAITATTAVFHGKLCSTIGSNSPREIASVVQPPFVFQYGTAPGTYNHTVDIVITGEERLVDRICVNVMASVTNLTPCKQYFVRFKYFDDNDNLPTRITGPEVKFSTIGCPIQPLGSGGPTTGTGTSLTLLAPVSAPVQMASVVVQTAAVITPKVSPGQSVDIAASVTNKGTANGDAKLTLYVNGEAVESKGVSVASGQTAPVHFYVSRNEPGTYSVSVNGVPAGSFTVDLFTNNDNLIYGIMALLLIGIAGTAYVLIRKRTA